MKIIVATMIAFWMVLLIAACSNTRPVTSGVATGSEMLYKSRWEVVELEGQPVIISAASLPFILFFPGQISSVSGNTGCNNFKGSFQLTGKNLIKFSPLTTTKMACLEKNMEPQFLDAFKKIGTWSIINDQLVFTNDRTVVMKLKTVSTESSQLDGLWELNYISGLRIAFDGLYPDKKPIIQFNLKMNELGGNTSCNGFSSKMILDGNKISVADPFAKTMIFCEGSGESTFLAMLKKVNSLKITGINTLTFMKDDLPLMRFKKIKQGNNL